VHFSLIVVCVALFVIKTSGPNTDLAVARKQILDIRQVHEELNKQWFERLAQSRVQAKGVGDVYSTDQTLQFVRAGHKVLVKITNTGPIITEVITRIPAEKSSHRVGTGDARAVASLYPELREQETGSLVAFRKLWDRMADDLRVATWPYLRQWGDIIALDRGNWEYFPVNVLPRKADDVDESLELTPISGTELDTITGHTSIEYALAFYDLHYALANPDHSLLLGISVVNESPLDAQRALKEKYPSLIVGKFENSFRELDRLTRGLQKDTIEELSNWLADQESQHRGESFEAFGIKFPAGATVLWGMLIILCIQLYFLLHLMELSPKLSPDDPGLEVPWIGLYPSAVSRLVLITSTLILPVLTIAVLPMNWQALSARKIAPLFSIRAVAVGVSIAASTGFSLALWKHLRRLPYIPKGMTEGARPATVPIAAPSQKLSSDESASDVSSGLS
jgi:hypothetical protein